MLFERLEGDSNRKDTNISRYSDQFNNLYMNGVFFSISKKEYESIYNIRMYDVHNGRLMTIILNHLHQYHRSIKSDICRLYNLNRKTTVAIIDKMLVLGYIKGYTVKKKSNLVYYVERTGYSITTEGVAALAQINELITSKINKMTKKQIKGF
jgi:DNA-binding MarR family transcriptional regulator